MVIFLVRSYRARSPDGVGAYGRLPLPSVGYSPCERRSRLFPSLD